MVSWISNLLWINAWGAAPFSNLPDHDEFNVSFTATKGMNSLYLSISFRSKTNSEKTKRCLEKLYFCLPSKTSFGTTLIHIASIHSRPFLARHSV